MKMTVFLHALVVYGTISVALVLITLGGVAPAVASTSVTSPLVTSPPKPLPANPRPQPAPRPLPSGPQLSANDSQTLGVYVVKPVFAKVPVLDSGMKNVVVSLTIWLRRVGATRGAFDMPHQSQDAIRMMVWADYPQGLHSRKYGRAKLPVSHRRWQPKLLVETPEPGPVLSAVPEAKEQQLSRAWDHALRPHSYRVDLPPGTGDCFKIIEASFPMHKTPVCIPPASTDLVCSTLAPPDRFSASKPALYATIEPIRHPTSTKSLRSLYPQIAPQIVNHVTYHIAMGLSGVLLYADAISRELLRQQRGVAELMAQGQLWLVEWDMLERSHDVTDNMGPPLGSNYDQALFIGHALLGLSACGANVMLVPTNMDEYVYFPKQGMRWPEPVGTCLTTTATTRAVRGNAAALTTLHKLARLEVGSSRYGPADEWRLWSTVGTLGRPSSGGSGSASGASSTVSRQHPLAAYDIAYDDPRAAAMGKTIALPAADIVLYLVRDGVPLYGQVKSVPSSCAVLLYVRNFLAASSSGPNGKSDRASATKFQHWLFTG